jgi:hypothetical protein
MSRLANIIHFYTVFYSGEHNIHTFLEFNDLPNITIERNTGENKVMRFHNEKFKEFVNKIIDFKKYELPHITKICDGKCKYTHENEITPYKIFQIPEIYTGDNNDIKINGVIEKIINYMKIEIIKYNYLPNNFMFIFPILSKNTLAERIEARLQDFWIDTFRNEEYQKKVLLKNEFWKDKINNDNYYKYVCLHKSEDGKPINLKESENSTRILSIHSSKGNGCEVVFLLGISDNALRMFSKERNNIVYDSLFHVAITRQKKSLYIGLMYYNDNVFNRIKGFEIEEDKTILPNLNKITCFVKYDKIIDYSINNEKFFKLINEKIITPNNYEKLLPDNKENTGIIDWGHHIIRHYVFIYNMLLNINNNDNIENDEEINHNDQFRTIIKKVSNYEIKYYFYKEYYKKVKENNSKKVKEIPVLDFESDDKSKYKKYRNIIIDIMKNIQNKIKNGENKLPFLCPIETIILYYMIYIVDDGIYSDISIMEIYSIMYCYDECSNSINDTHNKYDCLCKKSFSEGNNTDSKTYKDIRESIKNHYEQTKQLKNVYENYKNYIEKNYDKTEKFTYNINHYVEYKGNNNNFRIYNKYIIIAYSEKYVINIIIKPQFNKLNFTEVMFNGIFNSYILNNSSSQNNIKRYDNKKIITCIFTLDSIEPIFYELDISNNIIFKKCIEDYLINKYTENHKKIFDFYNYCKENKPNDKNSIIFTYEKISEYEKIPKYIEEFFYDLKKNSENINTKNNTIKIINDEELFLEEIKKYLKDYVNSFINNEINTNNDF